MTFPPALQPPREGQVRASSPYGLTRDLIDWTDVQRRAGRAPIWPFVASVPFVIVDTFLLPLTIPTSIVRGIMRRR